MFLQQVLALLLPIFALADVSLLAWTPPGFRYSYVIPQKESETATQALTRYLRTLKSNPELKPFADQWKTIGKGNLSPLSLGNNTAILAIANDMDDLNPSPQRAQWVLGPLESRGAKAYLAPIAVTAGLTETEAAQFRAKVNQNFDGLIAMGGDDIHPSLYGDPDPKGLAVNTNLSRDKEELSLIRAYLEEGQGMFAGICRGHQMGGVAASCELVKDIREELNLDHPRHLNHPITTTPDAGRLTREILDGNSSIVVNTIHHQSIKTPSVPNAKIKITAVATNQPAIAEIAEYYNGKGLSVQSHPELMTSSAYHARFYDTLYSEMDRANARRTQRPFSRIDLEKTLFGVEYTFQDENMVNEPGRMTFETPHKRAKFERFKSAYLEELKLAPDSLAKKLGAFKPGDFIYVPGDGKHVMNMEPVTIEVNTTPKTFTEILPAAKKIFAASEKADLLPYVNPAAERSGMGHIHVGAKTIGDSPFYKNPHLLRNMMVYLQKHPSLLWGFAEAYDIDGLNLQSGTDATNIETYHKPEQQKAFARAVKNFDEWYQQKILSGKSLDDGLRQFLLFLEAEEGPGIDFFRHYRFINLEHLRPIRDSKDPVDPKLGGKFTVEFRNFRPPRTPEHAVAHSELLLAMMEKLAEPGHLERLEEISPNAYDRFHSATKVAADWELVKRELPRQNPIWDDSVGEYVKNQLDREAIRAKLPKGLVAEIFPAYSPKTEKGTKFEMRLPVTSNQPPKIELSGTRLEFEKVAVDGKLYWVTTFNAERSGDGFVAEKVPALAKPSVCKQWFSVLQK
jgi:putative glutamine amidotransferase